MQTSLQGENMNDISRQMTDQNPNVIALRLLKKAHNRDGLPEIAAGVIFLLTAGLVSLQVVFQPGSPEYKASAWGMVLLIPTCILGTLWVIKKVRRQFLIPRVGYVEQKPISRKRIGIAFSLALIVAVTPVFAAHKGFSPSASWNLLGAGLLGGAIPALGGRMPRFVIGGGLVMATGILLAISGVTEQVGFTILYGFIGLLSVSSGSVVLWLLVRTPTGGGE